MDCVIYFGQCFIVIGGFLVAMIVMLHTVEEQCFFGVGEHSLSVKCDVFPILK